MAVVGGIFTLVITGTPFSVSAAIGFVALLGISVMDGVIVLSYFRRIVAEGRERHIAVIETGTTLLRPVVMTCVAACVGLVPAAISTGIGSAGSAPARLGRGRRHSARADPDPDHPARDDRRLHPGRIP